MRRAERRLHPSRVEAEHLDLARVAAPVALEDLDGRRLAGAVRAEQPEHLAGGDLEVDPAHGLDAAVRLPQAADRDRCGRSQRQSSVELGDAGGREARIAPPVSAAAISEQSGW